MRKDEEFSEWYNGIIDRAELSDKRYPIKGMNVWRPYGLAIMKLIDQAMREEFDSTGHGEVNFPVLIPETEFQKEADHVKGFEGDVFWVTRGGFNELDVKLVLRPTSETAMYPMFKLWIRSHADLPLKVYQIVPVFRYETKMTRSFMRVREIHFFEAHTAHATFEDAEQQIREDLQTNERLMRLLALPYLVSKRPDWDKFPGAYYSLGSDTLLPSGRSLQLATFHQYRDNFAKVYDVTYETESGEHKHVYQTTDGMSERILGALLAIHGDEKGLVLPPAAAPVQAVIVPVLEKGKQEEMLLEAQRLFLELREREVLLLGGARRPAARRARTPRDSEELRHGRATRHGGQARAAAGRVAGAAALRPRAHAGRDVGPRGEDDRGEHLHDHVPGRREGWLQPDGMVREGILRQGDHGEDRDERLGDAVLPGDIPRQVHRLRRADETGRLRGEGLLTRETPRGTRPTSCR